MSASLLHSGVTAPELLTALTGEQLGRLEPPLPTLDTLAHNMAPATRHPPPVTVPGQGLRG